MQKSIYIVYFDVCFYFNSINSQSNTASHLRTLQVQEEESVELGELHHSQRFEVKGGTENVYGKVNILLQAYISQLHIESYSLLSDSLYVAQVT